MRKGTWFTIGKPLSEDRKRVLLILSFLLPLLLWAMVSYVPFIWHPLVRITDPGDVSYFNVGSEVEKKAFFQANEELRLEGRRLAEGYRVNPVYLPAPHAVATAFYEAFVTPPRRSGEPWLHQSLLHSISVIFWAFALSSLIGVPLGIRYLPAPAFGALAVAVLGINDGPKIAIIFIGTFFQQILVISATTQKVRPTIIEAAQTLGAKKVQLLTKVIVPAILPDIYRDQRILLGWAWTYLIVAEVVGTSTGITWFIYQQAKYRVFDNVYAAIIMIGIIGLVSDMLLAALGKKFFPWAKEKKA